jgi:hypothetical protein
MRAGRLEYLVLCDSPVVLRRRTGDITVIADDRLARLPGGRPYGVEQVRANRNAPGGFWVASTRPEAASHAVCGSVPLDEVADAVLCTDGVTRLAEWYGHSWPAIFGVLAQDGPAALIRLLREAERAQPHPGAKQHDDATVIHLRVLGPVRASRSSKAPSVRAGAAFGGSTRRRPAPASARAPLARPTVPIGPTSPHRLVRPHSRMLQPRNLSHSSHSHLKRLHPRA